MSTGKLIRVGHKGADAIVRGNTLESLETAVEIGVDIVELDVLRPRTDFPPGTDWRGAEAGPAEPDRATGPLVVAHDWAAAARTEPKALTEVLDAFGRGPLGDVEIDLDLKIAGREDEVIAAVRARGLSDRAMVSTMEINSLEYLRDHAPELRRGWTLPRVTRDWTATRWARPLLGAGFAAQRARLPIVVAEGVERLGAWAVWVYHPLITKRLVESAHAAGSAVIAWTVDDAERIEVLRALEVDGICTNDPRLLN